MWWEPDAGSIARAIGWWWIVLMLVAAAALALIVIWYLMGRMGWIMAAGQIKLLLVLGGVALSIVLYGMKRVSHARNDPFCIHCGYSLTGLAENGTCPECGRGYNAAVIAEYRKDPHFFQERCRLARERTLDGVTIQAGPAPSPPSSDGT